MEISIEELREIASHLPTGYYLGARLPVLIEDGESAFFDPVKSEAHIGVGIVNKALSKIDESEGWTKEMVVRTLVYHELAHCLLTPAEFADNWFGSYTSRLSPQIQHAVFNIFEDERIERILNKVFIGVNFKGLVRKMNKAGGKDDVSRFFDAVRLGITTDKIRKKITKIIRDHAAVNSASGTYRSNKVDIGNPGEYMRNVAKLFDEIAKSKNEQQERTGAGRSNPENSEQSEGCDSSGKEERGQYEGRSGHGESDDGRNATAAGIEPEEDDTFEGVSVEYLKNVMTLVANIYEPSKDVKKALAALAVRLSKKAGANGCGRWSPLSGKIVPRRDALDMDGIFRKAAIEGQKISSAVNLTLWIDSSGSFSRSQTHINQIVRAAAEAAKMSGGSLKLNVCSMGEQCKVMNPSNMEIICTDSNNIDDSFVEAYRETRDGSMRNIDIVVFDGSALTACDRYERKDAESRAGKIWNSRDCYIVSDKSNERLFTEQCPNAVKEFIRDDYAERLEATMLKVLNMIM